MIRGVLGMYIMGWLLLVACLCAVEGAIPSLHGFSSGIKRIIGLCVGVINVFGFRRRGA